MKILFFTFGTEILPSSRTRVYQFIPHLKKRGITCKVISYLSKRRSKDDISMKELGVLRKIVDKIYSWLKILKFLFLVPRYDIVFIQRVLLPICIQRFIRCYNKTVIFDFDDALQLVEDRFFSRFTNLLCNSDTVIVENDFNKKFVSQYNPHVRIITGPIDTEIYRPQRRQSLDGTVVIGWIGTSSTTKYLEIVKDVFKTLKEKYRKKIIITLIGSGKLNWGAIDYRSVEWNLNTESEELKSLDIGIMPLEDDEWCRGKGGYKLLQYMSLGIPCIASSVGVNREIIREGINGFLADNSEEWIEKLSLLIENMDLRLRMGREGRKIAEEQYSYEKNVLTFISILKEIKDGK